ncbi:MAG: hypothetical protein ACO37F_10835, partial [Pirellulales bacterium]
EDQHRHRQDEKNKTVNGTFASVLFAKQVMDLQAPATEKVSKSGTTRTSPPGCWDRRKERSP